MHLCVCVRVARLTAPSHCSPHTLPLPRLPPPPTHPSFSASCTLFQTSLQPPQGETEQRWLRYASFRSALTGGLGGVHRRTHPLYLVLRGEGGWGWRRERGEGEGCWGMEAGEGWSWDGWGVEAVQGQVRASGGTGTLRGPGRDLDVPCVLSLLFSGTQYVWLRRMFSCLFPRVAA